MLLTVRTTGYVTKDLVLMKGKQSGTEYVRLNMSVNKGYGDKKRTIYLQATFFGEKAERLINAKVKKGSSIELAGDIDDVIAFAKEGTGELVTMLKVIPYDWDYAPHPPKKEDFAGTTVARIPTSSADVTVPVQTYGTAPEVECGTNDELPY